jgi:cytochrome c oxidase subunit 2
LTLGALAVTAILLLTACGPDGIKPYSTTSPASPTANGIQDLYKLVFWLALIVFVGVQFTIVYTSLRFRRKNIPANRPPQVHGNKRLEIAWTIIPAVVLLIILIPTITTMFDESAAADDGDITIDVYAKQWWWEIHYSTDNDQGGKSLDVITANELYLPEGKNAVIRLHSNNVIHSFWVPRLSGKMDVIPGHINKVSITPNQTGDFYGECAEFCGAQHAWMRFKVIVTTEPDFYTWINDMREGNPSTTNQDATLPAGVTKAPAKFSLCLGCHQVNGMEGSIPMSALLDSSPTNTTAGMGAPANLGPNLTNLGCRETIGAGILKNNVEDVTSWLEDPGAVKPGNYMADVIKKGTLTNQEAHDVAVFLESLKPAGGCVTANGPVPNAATPAAVSSPVAVKPAGG